jgi:hypothetical protein
VPRGRRKQRIPLSRLGKPSRLPITPEQILSLANEWGRDVQGENVSEKVWEDVKLLADQFLVAPENDPQACVAWHHLLLAVGNFKRSTGPIVPCTLPKLAEALTEERPDRFRIPGPAPESWLVVAGDMSTWARLTSIEGLAVPTASTLLAAIWPREHIIIDRRDLTAAVGLGAGELWTVDGLDEAYLPRRDSHDLYWKLYGEWFRDTVLITADTDRKPGQVERALYRLDQRTRNALPSSWKWSQYRAEADRQLLEVGA